MTVYLAAQPGLSRAMDRVVKALTASAPRTVTIARTEAHAELVVLHVIGYPETVEAIARCRERGQRYAIIQYCFRTTHEPLVGAWLPLWRGAQTTWSYYNLIQETRDDVGHYLTFPFYYAPLGVDALFLRATEWQHERQFLAGCSGYVAESECLREVADGAKNLGRVFHVGPELHLGDHVLSRLNVPDYELRGYWNSCHYVTGLRRVEGFELPVYEGLACGSRPIVFDRPHYRHWLEDHAVYVPETDPAELTQALSAVFAGSPPTPVSRSEKLWLEDRFNWMTIGRGFWERAL